MFVSKKIVNKPRLLNALEKIPTTRKNYTVSLAFLYTVVCIHFRSISFFASGGGLPSIP